MQVVVDKNCLRAPADGATARLETFLREDRSNRAILTSFAELERYAPGNPVKNLFESTRILSRFPGQVAVVKDVNQLVRFGLITPSVDLVDAQATQAFFGTCAMAQRANAGNVADIAFIEARGRAALEHRDGMRDDIFLIWGETVARTAKYPEAVKARRDGELISVQQYAPMVEFTVWPLAEALLDVIGGSDKTIPRLTLLGASQVCDFYIFRYAIGLWNLALRWAVTNGPKGGLASPDKLRRDFIDLTYAVQATYFDDLMTDDAKTANLYHDVRVTVEWMSQIGRPRETGAVAPTGSI